MKATRPERTGELDPALRETQDPALRPRSFDEFVGQKRVVENLRIYVRAAKQRGEALDHVLLCGPPGLGKTSLAHIIAEELGVDVQPTSGPAIERAGDLAGVLTKLGPRQVLFIDEIHRLSRAVEEYLYPAVEDYRLDISLGQGPASQSVRVALERFTLIGATTRAGLLTRPLRDRFHIHFNLDFYAPDELAVILERAAARMDVPLEPDAGRELARRSRGTPRIAIRLLRRVRDFAQVDGLAGVGLPSVHRALDEMGIDAEGLDELDRKVLETIALKFGGGPVGVDTLATAIGEEPDVIEYVNEPFLIMCGFLQRTQRGRIITALGRRHLGLGDPSAEGPQKGLFETT